MNSGMKDCVHFSRSIYATMRKLQLVQIGLVFLLMLSINGVENSQFSTCKTKWFNGNSLTSNGDCEKLEDLLSQFPGQICTNPIGIEARTTSGLPASQSRNSFSFFESGKGICCLNSNQTEEACQDYEVMFTCSGEFCSGCVTRWFNLADVSETGDFEFLELLKEEHSDELCDKPIAIEAQAVSGLPPSQTGDVIQLYDADRGFSCLNIQQEDKRCEDYQVRYICPEEFCNAPLECRTKWFDSSDVTDKGDDKRIKRLLELYPGELCKYPVGIQAQNISGIPASSTGQTIIVCETDLGFYCLNENQPNGEKCHDYKVSFTCPSDFCSGCRTEWFNCDDPSGTGDWETLTDLREKYPGKICSTPIGIKAQTVGGVPASVTGDILHTYDATSGFICLNEDQTAKQCEDYQVRFTCPPEFCSGYQD
nr:PREDICTED: uncharacterized protein LOC102355527 [Latimeria chalumnae]|eukprot:XP_006008904.1 PREDICTED: uncharacterized protein LOC102355527 [Latimeria chalumnae]